MSPTAIIFMAAAWAFVLGLSGWSWYKLLTVKEPTEHPPPPGTSL
ncbi:MAG: hypothetical protein AABY91_10045 [Gemmatimonadota bacterium]